MPTSFDLRIVAQQLLELTGLTMAELARRGEVHRPNCLAWLAGKEQVFSEKKQLKVCEFLGWRYGRLRRDVVHHWQVGNDLSTLKAVLAAYEAWENKTLFQIFQVEGPQAEKAVILVGLCEGLPHLLILIKRPLGYGAPVPITAKSLGIGIDREAYRLSAREWQEWWIPDAVARDPDAYLRAHGDKLIEVADSTFQATLDNELTPVECDDEMVLEGGMLSGLTPEEQEWLAVLQRALDTGMSFQEIMSRAGMALDS